MSAVTKVNSNQWSQTNMSHKYLFCLYSDSCFRLSNCTMAWKNAKQCTHVIYTNSKLVAVSPKKFDQADNYWLTAQSYIYYSANSSLTSRNFCVFHPHNVSRISKHKNFCRRCANAKNAIQIECAIILRKKMLYENEKANSQMKCSCCRGLQTDVDLHHSASL